MISPEDVSRIVETFVRLANLYDRLESGGYDFGTGELIFPAEIHALEAIGRGGGGTVSALAARFGVTKGAVSQIVRKLSDKSLVRKEQNPDYRKETILSLTGKGRKAFEGHERLHRAMDTNVYKAAARFTKEDLEKVEVFMAIMEAQLVKYIAAGKSA